LGSIAEREDEAGNEDRGIEPFQNDSEDETSRAEELWVAEGKGEDVEDEEEVALLSTSELASISTK
jgi:hypothetical protein